MPRRELKFPSQVENWLKEWGGKLDEPAELILIGSGALLWHAAQKGIETPLPENSMDVDSITNHDAVAALGYDAHIGSEFERLHGWHVNLMPNEALAGFPQDWRARAGQKRYGMLNVIVPAARDLLIPKIGRGEPRDLAHARWAKDAGLC